LKCAGLCKRKTGSGSAQEKGRESEFRGGVLAPEREEGASLYRLDREETQSGFAISLNNSYTLCCSILTGPECRNIAAAQGEFFKEAPAKPEFRSLSAHMRYDFATSRDHCAHSRSMQNLVQPANELFLAALPGQVLSQSPLTVSNDFNSFVSLRLKNVSIKIIV
jgi:hypothetical protein